jgi:uncharacterized protein DUF6117
MAISDGYKRNFDTLLKAAKDGNLGLMECTDALTGEMRAVICAIWVDPKGVHHMVPFGHMCPGNPYDEYIPPSEMDAKGTLQ